MDLDELILSLEQRCQRIADLISFGKMWAYAEYQTGLGDSSRAPAGRRATESKVSSCHKKEYRELTGKEEFRNQCSGRRLDDIVGPQQA